MHNDISITKNGKNAYVKPIISITKEGNNAWIEDITTTSKYFHNTRLSQDEFVFSNFYESSILDSLFVDKTEQICYYDYGVFADKSEYLDQKFEKMVIKEAKLIEQNEPIVIELNSSQPGVIGEQLCTGPIFGDRTHEVLDYCSKKEFKYQRSVFTY